MKTCKKCDNEQPTDNFPAARGTPRSVCKTCESSARKKRRHAQEQKELDGMEARNALPARERFDLALADALKMQKRAAAQRRLRAKKKAEKAGPKKAGTLDGLSSGNRTKVLEWARRYITLTSEQTWLDDVLRRGHEPFKDNNSWGRAAELLHRSDVVRDQLLYLPMWMARYLPANAVAKILKDRLGRRDLLLEDRAKVEARWLAKEQAEIDAHQRAEDEWQAKYAATPSDRHPVERTIRAKHPDGVVSVFTMPLSSDNDLLIPDRAYDDGEDWKEVIRVLSEQDGVDYGLMLQAGRGDSEIDFAAKRTLPSRRAMFEGYMWPGCG